MIEETAQFLARGGIPEAHRLVGTTAGQSLAVGRKGQAAHFPLMPLEGADFLASGRVPEPDNAVIAGSGNQLAIAAVGQGGHRPGMAEAKRAESGEGPFR